MAKKVVSEPMLNGACTRSHLLFPRSFPTGQTLRELFQSHKQTASKKKADFTRNRTRPPTKSNPFLLPKKRSKATKNEGWDLRWAEKKGGNPTRW